MTKISWTDPETRTYQVGVNQCVYFDSDGVGHAWSGLISVVEGEDRNEDAPMYIDGVKVLNRKRFGDFSASIEIVTPLRSLPDFLKDTFSFAYRVDFSNHYEIHLVYNASAVVNPRSRSTVQDAPELSIISLEVSTLPRIVDFDRRTSHLVISSSIARSDALEMFENWLYGDASNDSSLPTPDEVLEIFESHAILRVTDLRNGSYEISGPDEVVYQNLDGSWTIDWPSVIQVHDTVYQISSL